VALNIVELEAKTIAELYKMAREMEVTGYSKLRKKELIFEILHSIFIKISNTFNILG